MGHVVNDDACFLAGQFENDRLTDPALFFRDMTNLSISHAGLLRTPQALSGAARFASRHAAAHSLWPIGATTTKP
jgi:hypothetical protein